MIRTRGDRIKLSIRERILTAAAEVMRTKGLARSTTKEIARASGFSEATLYKHFASQEELFLAVLGERLPGFIALLLNDLPARVGRGTVPRNLQEVACAAVALYGQVIPLSGAYSLSRFSRPTTDRCCCRKALVHIGPSKRWRRTSGASNALVGRRNPSARKQ